MGLGFMSIVFVGTDRLLALQTIGAGGWLGFAPLIFIFAIFYFLLIRPQQKRQQELSKLVENLKKGDRVITSGGVSAGDRI